MKYFFLLCLLCVCVCGGGFVSEHIFDNGCSGLEGCLYAVFSVKLEPGLMLSDSLKESKLMLV